MMLKVKNIPCIDIILDNIRF
jgi:hypothetical protein